MRFLVFLDLKKLIKEIVFFMDFMVDFMRNIHVMLSTRSC